MEEQINRYIKLILERCMNFKKSNILFIDYDVSISDFALKIKKYAEDKLNLNVYLHQTNIYETKHLLTTLSKDEIKKHPVFNDKKFDEYAKKNASFLLLESVFPNVLKDVDPKILEYANKIKMNNKKIYREKQLNSNLVWLIAVYPNHTWAKHLFKNLSYEQAYNKLFSLIMKVVLCNNENPIKKWNEIINKNIKMVEKLNNLKITELHYYNKLGTDLHIKLNEFAIWTTASLNELNIIENMPSYEIFTSPDCRYTEGIVYASMPLTYASNMVKDFYIKFKNGKVTGYDAKTGKKILKSIIETDEGTKYLGECALVEKDSPIAKTKFIFEETCLDENQSCHIALGSGFKECIKNFKILKESEFKKIGLNKSSNHVDFMIGTNDLCIDAQTCKGKITLFKNGKFNI